MLTGCIWKKCQWLLDNLDLDCLDLCNSAHKPPVSGPAQRTCHPLDSPREQQHESSSEIATSRSETVTRDHPAPSQLADPHTISRTLLLSGQLENSLAWFLKRSSMRAGSSGTGQGLLRQEL